MRTKSGNTWNLPHKHCFCKCYNVHEDCIKFDTEQIENTKSAERQKTSFPKELVENACIEQNNDHRGIIREIEFHSSFNKFLKAIINKNII